MKLFDKTNGPWDSKVNYVDAANRVLGYDMFRDCCESFGHGVFSSVRLVDRDTASEAHEIAAYSFANDEPTALKAPGEHDDAGGSVCFRICAAGLPDLFVILWNYHNGYYSHGFDFNGTTGAI